MYKITLIEIIFRAIPEALVYVLAMYSFSGKELVKKNYFKSTAIIVLIMFLARLLPVSYGIHTILIIMGTMGVAIFLNKVETIQAVTISIINVIIQFISEGLNIIIVEKVLHKDMQEIVSVPIQKVYYGIPSIAIWAIIILLLRKFVVKRVGRKNVKYTESM